MLMRNGYWKQSQKDYVVYNRTLPAQEGQYADYPESLLPEIKSYLSEKGIDQLYCHQADMFERAQEKKNIVITTSTASGKTLSFLLPVLQEILKHPSSRALFIYPTKALASDQMRALAPFIEYFGNNRISAGVYDGDTTPNERSRIRNSANIILTNPDMLNSAFLPHHSNAGFSFMFSNLKFVVIDELHSYRGAFGSHLANVFRRLGRICRYYSSSPQFLCSSATIANPIELAENICGKEFVLIDKDGSPSPDKHYHFIQPPKIGLTEERIPASKVTAELIPELVMENHSFIAFCRARSTVEVVVKEARERLTSLEQPGLSYADLIAGYRGGYKPEERKLLERKMVSGEMKGLVSTNALELGIDIGKVDTTILTGYPGTRASFWQQSGRAGRSKNSSDTYLVLDNRPQDQYLAIDPDWLFAAQSENAVVDKNNLFIQLAHVRAAAAELPLSLDDQAIFPDISEIIPILMKANELRLENGKFRWCGKDYPAGDFSLRNIDKERYKLVDQNSVTIAEFDEMQAFCEIHKGSIYIHNGQSYHVLKLDLEAKTAYAEPVGDNYFTAPWGNLELSLIKEQKDSAFARTSVHYGDIKDCESILGHKKVQFHNHQNLGFEYLDVPLSKEYETEGTWIIVPQNVVDVFYHLTPEKPGVELISNVYKGYMGGLMFCIHNAAKMSTMTIDSDIGTEIMPLVNDQNEKITSICVFDRFTGGMGYAEKVYDIVDTVVQNAMKMVKGCTCKHGCPACVGDYRLDKNVVLWGLENFYKESVPPIDMNTLSAPEVPIIEKPFAYETLCEKWSEFQQFIRETGEATSQFLSQVVIGAKKDGSKLILLVNSAIALMQAQSDENKWQIKNIIMAYVNAPLDLVVDFELSESSNNDSQEKLTRHFGTLTGR